MSWFYGLAREKSGKIRLWEIYEEKKYLWGHRAYWWWAIKEIKHVIRDLWFQYKNYRTLFNGEELEKGVEKQVKKWSKAVKETIKELKVGDRIRCE